ncbi:hypothetical protein WN943_019673 [Citrus x changshan-huyou]
MAAINHARHTATKYLPKYFTKEAYLNTYAVMFKSIPDKVTWDPCDRPKLSPPEITKKIGRPKKKYALRPSIARELKAQKQGVSGPGESSNAVSTLKRTKKMVVHKSGLLIIEEDEVLVIKEKEGIEAEGAKGVIEQEQEMMK